MFRRNRSPNNVLFLLSLFVWLRNIRKEIECFVCNCIIVIMSFRIDRANAHKIHISTVWHRSKDSTHELRNGWTVNWKETNKEMLLVYSARAWAALKLENHSAHVITRKTSLKHMCFDFFIFSNIKLAPAQQLQLRAKSTFAHLLNMFICANQPTKLQNWSRSRNSYVCVCPTIVYWLWPFGLESIEIDRRPLSTSCLIHLLYSTIWFINFDFYKIIKFEQNAIYSESNWIVQRIE